MPATLYTSGYGGTIHTLSFDPSGPSLTQTAEIPAGAAPTWLLLHPTQPVLYAVDEFAEGDGVLTAYTITSSGSLEVASTARSGGNGPVHLVLSEDLTQLFVSNYMGATVASLEMDPATGFFASVASEPSQPTQVFKFTGKGPREDRQEAPHPHGVFLDPTKSLLFNADLGSDTLQVWSVKKGAKMERLDDIPVAKGAGPRHLIFSQRGSKTLLYLLLELSNEVSIFELVYPSSTSTSASLEPLQLAVSVLPTDQSTEGAWTAAELSLTPGNTHLIVSNRSPDEPTPKDTDVVAIFEVKEDGTLKTPHSQKAIGGRGLRHFELNPARKVKGLEDGGKYVAVGCQKTNEVVMFEWKNAQLVEVARVGGIKEPTVVIWA
ncbi:putative isomerase YbhE [Meredithblackwellia eburnea MCA 4105]